ncbi:MAG TPA: hypothetical protein VGG50_13340, partial [Streptosporangiaceae bacterium]
MTAEPARAEPELACAEPEFRRPGRPDGSPSWLVRALTMLDPDGQVGPDRPAIFRTLAAALSVRTGAFVVLDDQPGRWTVRALGPEATSADAEWAVRSAAGGPTGPHGLWLTAGADADECAVAVAGPAVAADVIPVLATARRMLREARLTAAAVEAEAEVDALRIVAGRILRARELDDALLAVTNETLRLVASDIAGVMLRDGDEIFMRSCAGNQRADTAHLRMRRGQGLAGLVFATGE